MRTCTRAEFRFRGEYGQGRPVRSRDRKKDRLRDRRSAWRRVCSLLLERSNRYAARPFERLASREDTGARRGCGHRRIGNGGRHGRGRPCAERTPHLDLERGEHLRDDTRSAGCRRDLRARAFRPDETWLTPGGGAVQSRELRLRRRQHEVLRRRADALSGPRISRRAPYGRREPGLAAELRRDRTVVPKGGTLLPRAGALGEDPTEPRHSGPTPSPRCPTSRRSPICVAGCRRPGLHPASSAAGRRYRPHGCPARDAWDAFPDTTGAKMDAESVGLAEALKHPNVELQDRRHGRAAGAVRRAASPALLTTAGRIEADQVVLAAGAVHTPVLLLRSASGACPRTASPTGPTRSGATS
jgi:choline dehydrogenase-like flavoprotein